MVQRKGVKNGVASNKTIKTGVYLHEEALVYRPVTTTTNAWSRPIDYSLNKNKAWELLDDLPQEETKPRETKSERKERNRDAKKSEFKDQLASQKQKQVKRKPVKPQSDDEETEPVESQPKKKEEEGWTLVQSKNFYSKTYTKDVNGQEFVLVVPNDAKKLRKIKGEAEPYVGWDKEGKHEEAEKRRRNVKKEARSVVGGTY
jgi:hypothetical protein